MASPLAEWLLFTSPGVREVHLTPSTQPLEHGGVLASTTLLLDIFTKAAAQLVMPEPIILGCILITFSVFFLTNIYNWIFIGVSLGFLFHPVKPSLSQSQSGGSLMVLLSIQSPSRLITTFSASQFTSLNIKFAVRKLSSGWWGDLTRVTILQ